MEKEEARFLEETPELVPNWLMTPLRGAAY